MLAVCGGEPSHSGRNVLFAPQAGRGGVVGVLLEGGDTERGADRAALGVGRLDARRRALYRTDGRASHCAAATGDS